MLYNFNICPQNGKTYFEIETSWRERKKLIKIILDDRNSCKEIKIIRIISILEDYRDRYLQK